MIRLVNSNPYSSIARSSNSEYRLLVSQFIVQNSKSALIICTLKKKVQSQPLNYQGLTLNSEL